VDENLYSVILSRPTSTSLSFHRNPSRFKKQQTPVSFKKNLQTTLLEVTNSSNVKKKKLQTTWDSSPSRLKKPQTPRDCRSRKPLKIQNKLQTNRHLRSHKPLEIGTCVRNAPDNKSLFYSYKFIVYALTLNNYSISLWHLILCRFIWMS